MGPGHFPLGLAMLCVNCESLFAAERACPGCGSAEIFPVEKFLMRRCELQVLKSA